MAQDYIPDRSVSYGSKTEFLSGEGIPQEFWNYFDEYDPAAEELLLEEAELGSRKMRFQLGKQKRDLLSQTGKMGFAKHGAMEKGAIDLMSMFQDEATLAESQTAFDVDATRQEWLNVQYDTASLYADDIVSAKRSVGDLISDIHSDDSHWEKSNLNKYDDTKNERQFMRYMEQEGSSEWDTWKKRKWNDHKELQRSFAKRKGYSAVTSLRDPGV